MIDLSKLEDLHGLGPLDLALGWAARGVPVLPTNPENKAPWIGKEWERKATTDPETIRSWAQWGRGARVGIKTGLACGCGCLDGPDVLDFDVSDGKPGIEQRRILVDAGVLDGTQALRVRTPTGGEHWWFYGTTQHNKQNDDAVWGIDFRAHHGMVLAPGNPGYDIKGQPWDGLGKIDWALIQGCPGLRIKPPKPGVAPPVRPAARSLPPAMPSKLVAPSRFDNAPGEESPLDWFCRTTDLGKMLSDDGWTYAYTHQDRDYYVRPGKDVKAGVSANIYVNPDGRQTLVNFSTSVDLPTDRGLSAAQYLAYRDHGGDVRAAASQIRRHRMPQRLPVPPATQRLPAGPSGPSVPAVPPVGTPGRDLVPAGDAGPPDAVRTFWSQRPELREVWFKAVVGGVSPWAVLGNILANIAGRVGPHVCLPPRGGVGKAASLNILVGVMGNSGTGKGLSGPIAREFMGAPWPPQRKPGTGQGIAAMFTVQTKEGPVQENDTVILNVSEIIQLGAHMSQQGATITSTLLEVYMGEELGEHYANKELRRPVRDGAYRLAMVAGIQPGNAHIVFDHAESGLPQRFIWMPAFWSDAVLPEGSLRPPAPGSEPARWRVSEILQPGSLCEPEEADWSPTDVVDKTPGKKGKEPEAVAVPTREQILVVYAPAVRREIERDHNLRLNALKKRLLAGEDDPGDPDSHLLLTRAKVAALLAIWLDHTWYVSEQVWELSKWIMWVSTDTRLKAHARLRAKAAEKTAGRAAAKVAEKTMVDEAEERKHHALAIKISDRVVTIVRDDWVVYKLISQGLAGRDKKAMREAGIQLQDMLDELVTTGAIERREPEGAERGARYRARR